MPGKFSSAITPWIRGMLDALDDPSIKKVVAMKSAQAAWTEGVWNNYLGRRIHTDPCPVVLLFPKEKTIRKYLDQKFVPMIEATPVLRAVVDVTTSRSAGNRSDFKRFPGGFLALVASNAPDNVKSLSAPVVCVEEPDDCNTNIQGQGDSVKLLEERTKTYEYRKVIFGGTPTTKGLSRVEEAYAASDRRRFMVPCHDCGEAHALTWDQVIWDTGDGPAHEVYGLHKPETARYACPHCGSIWRDTEKNRNVRKGFWQAEEECRGVAGFHINELYSPFPGSRLAALVERYLGAQHAMEQGDDGEMIVFVNSCLGLPYEFKTDAPREDELAARAMPYSERTVPAGGLVLTMGVDVQNDRLAIIIRAWGRSEESWLVYWGEIAAVTGCADKNDPVWKELDSFLFGTYEHADGFPLRISAAGVDSSDGGTNDAVYDYVRSRKNRGIKLMALKGKADKESLDREIVTPARKVDVQRNATKAARYGLQVYVVGVHKAKDLLDGRLKLDGHGPGRMHWYEGVRSDYYAQLTSEIKAPSRTQRGKRVWQKKSGVRNEAWDCEVYSMHGARVLKLHVRKPDQWDALEAELRQGDLLEQVQPVADYPSSPSTPVSALAPVQPHTSGSFADLARRLR